MRKSPLTSQDFEDIEGRANWIVGRAKNLQHISVRVRMEESGELAGLLERMERDAQGLVDMIREIRAKV